MVAPIQADRVDYGSGIRGRALLGGEGIVLRYPRRLLPVETGSVEMWVRLVEPLDKGRWRFFFSDGTRWGPRGMPRLWLQSGLLRYDLDGGSRYFTVPPPPWPDHQWMHVVFTWDSAGSTVLYADGSRIGALGTQAWQAEPTDSFRIGSGLSIPGDATLPAYALIDEVAIYRQVLTPEQVAHMYRRMGLPRLDLRADQPVLDAGAGDAVFALVNAGYGRARGRVHWTDAEGEQEVHYHLGHDEALPLRVAIAGAGPGRHRVVFALREYIPSAEETESTMQSSFYIRSPARRVPEGEIAWQPVAEIDCSAQAPASEIGTGRVLDSALGRYREAGPDLADRFVYPFVLARADRLVRLTITYPDDAVRAAGIACWGPPQEALGSGYMCGDELPLTHAMVTRRFVFFCRSRHAAIVVQTDVAGQPAAIASMTLEEAPPRLVPAAAPSLQARSHRRIGLYWEDPILSRCFGEPDTTAPADFEHVLERVLDYCRWAGLDLISYPVYWYAGPMYDSRVTSGFPLGQRMHPPDFPERMARRCAERGILFIPSMNPWKLSCLSDRVRPPAEVIRGVPSVNCVTADGFVMGYEGISWTRGPALNALHPEVQKAVTDLTLEVAAACAPHASFGGVDFMLWPSTAFRIGAVPSEELGGSYDDYSIGQFAAFRGETPPGEPTRADRFAQRYRWIAEHPERREAWIQWRCDQMTRFYHTLAAALSAAKPGARLGLAVYEPADRRNHEGRDTLPFLRAQGLDPAALAKCPHISLKRFKHQLAQRWRTRMKMDTRPANLNLANDPHYQAPFRGIPGVGVLLHQQYFETPLAVDRQLILPAPFPAERDAMGPNSGMRVTEPLPSGRDYLRYFAWSVRNLDATQLAVGGYVLGTQGAEPELREFALAFTALPAVRFDDLFEEDNILLRRAEVEEARWFYLLNLNPRNRRVVLTVDGGNVTRADTGEILDGSRGRCILDLLPYQLVSFKAPPPASMTVEETR